MDDQKSGPALDRAGTGDRNPRRPGDGRIGSPVRLSYQTPSAGRSSSSLSAVLSLLAELAGGSPTVLGWMKKKS